MARPLSGHLGLLALATLALAACGAGPAARAPSGADLTVYAAQGSEITDPILDAYRARNPRLRVELIRAGTGEMLSRIRAERESPLGDLLWGGALEAYVANADLFAPAALPEADRFEAADPALLWHPFTTNVIHLAANTARLQAPLPRSFRELADARWWELGGIALSNPAASGTGYSVVTALVTALGWEFVDDLLRNCRLTDSSDSMFKWVKDGETALGFLFETTLRDYVAAGAPLRAVVAAEGLITQTDGYGLLAGARHRQAALAFMAYLESEEAQQIVRRQVGRRSARSGVAPAAGLLDLADRPRIRPDPEWSAREREPILARYEAAREKAGR